MKKSKEGNRSGRKMSREGAHLLYLPLALAADETVVRFPFGPVKTFFPLLLLFVLPLPPPVDILFFLKFSDSRSIDSF